MSRLAAPVLILLAGCGTIANFIGWECPSCGRTASVSGDCCGTPRLPLKTLGRTRRLFVG